MITVNELPDSPPTFVVLYCSACGATYSANRGDYFTADPNQVLNCHCHDDLDISWPLAIVTRRTVYDHDRGQRWLQ